MCVCVLYVCTVCMSLYVWRSNYFLPLYGSQGSEQNQAWQQAALPTKPPAQSCCFEASLVLFWNSGSHHVTLTSLELHRLASNRNLPASASRVLELKGSTTHPGAGFCTLVLIWISDCPAAESGRRLLSSREMETSTAGSPYGRSCKTSGMSVSELLKRSEGRDIP